MSVRRLALFPEESLFRGTRWVVFEPNDGPPWNRIRLLADDFLLRRFRRGAFARRGEVGSRVELSREHAMAVRHELASAVLTDLLFEEPGVGRCLVAPDGSVLRANGEWLRATGLALDDVIGANIIELFPETRDMALAMHARARAGHRVAVPRHAQRIQGRETWWDGSIAPVPMENGTGLLITARELTGVIEDLAAEVKHPVADPGGRAGEPRRSEAILEAFFANSPAIVSLLDDELRYVRTCRVTPTYFGLDRETIVGKALEDLAPAVAQRFGPMMRRVIETGEPATNVEISAELPSRPGEVRQWRASYFPVPLADGRRGLGVVGVEITDLKRAEEVLRISEEGYRTLFTNMTEGFALCEVVCDEAGAPRDFRVLDMNDAFERQSGLANETTRGRPMREVLPGLEQSWLDTFYGIALGAPPRRFESYNRDLDRHFSVYCFSPARGRFAVLFTDVSERKGIEATLREAEERAQSRAAELEVVLDTVPAAVWIAHDREASRITANRFGAELLRSPPRSNVSVTGPPEERPTNFRPMKNGVQIPPDELPIQASARFGREFRDFEFDVVFDDGMVRHLLGNSSPIRDATGSPRGSVGAFIDITERKLAEARSASLARFPQENPDPVLRLDGSLRVLYVNEAARLRLRSILPDAGAAAQGVLAETARHAVAEGRHVKTEIACGAAVFSISVVPVGGEVNVYAQDITARKRGEEALREADRRKDEFLGMLSHELRNPLAPIRNSVYVLRHADPGGDQARRAQEVIERQTEHLTRLVDDLLDVTRIARGKIELRRSRVDLREVLWRASDDFRFVMEERGVGFHAVLPETELWADADATRVAQLVGNLLHNAVKFTQRGDEVTLSLEAVGGEAEIHVRDTGAGIDPALLPHVFEPFVQGERTLARTEGGLGLGLALVKGIAELHRGAVRAESAGKGKGADFTVRLPLVESAVAPDTTRAAVQRRSGGRRVLVVDDHADAARSLADVVAMLGHEVEVAHDGPSALAKARANPPDIVLCDIGLPGMSGYAVAKALRQIGGGMQLFAVSGYAQPEDVKKAIEAGFDGHLAKPLAIGDVERLLA